MKVKIVKYLTVSLITLTSLTAKAENWKFAVFSDVHHFSSELTDYGEAFKKKLSKDRKILHLSEPILDQTIQEVIEKKPDFVIICGDLTKDGAFQSHQDVAQKLKKLESTGIQAYVIPGNHDVSNYQAESYFGDQSSFVSSVTEEEFKEMYADFGYNEAISQANDSASYVVEPKPGLWLIGLDSTLSHENTPEKTKTSGEISSETFDWLKEIIHQGKSQNKAMTVFMHHGLIPHFESQTKYFSQYLIKNWREVGTLLAESGIRTVFTGHFHAQDVAKESFPTRPIFQKQYPLFDIQTGSLLTYPIPYRIINMNKEYTDIKSYYIKEIPGKKDFNSYAKKYLLDSIPSLLTHFASKVNILGHSVILEDTKKLAPQFAPIFTNHYQGDESGNIAELDKSGLSLTGHALLKLTQDFQYGIQTDSEGSDNNIKIYNNGAWYKTESN